MKLRFCFSRILMMVSSGMLCVHGGPTEKGLQRDGNDIEWPQEAEATFREHFGLPDGEMDAGADDDPGLRELLGEEEGSEGLRGWSPRRVSIVVTEESRGFVAAEEWKGSWGCGVVMKRGWRAPGGVRLTVRNLRCPDVVFSFDGGAVLGGVRVAASCGGSGGVRLAWRRIESAECDSYRCGGGGSGLNEFLVEGNGLEEGGEAKVRFLLRSTRQVPVRIGLEGCEGIWAVEGMETHADARVFPPEGGRGGVVLEWR